MPEIIVIPAPPDSDEIVFDIVAVYPKYSFVQGGNPDTQACNGDPGFCLPMSDPGNVQFQVELDLIGDAVPYYNLYAVPVPCDMVCTDHHEAPYTSGSITPGSTSYQIQLISLLPFALIVSEHLEPLSGIDAMAYFDTVPAGTSFDSRSTLGVPDTLQGTMVLHETYSDVAESIAPYAPANILTTIEEGQCFRLQYIYEILDSLGNVTFRHYIGGSSNCFIRTSPGECYSSVISYINTSDAFGFRYEWNIPNIIELPLYLRDPKMENDQKVYTRSDGSITKLYERKEEVYVMETDQMPYIWHKALDIALSHDTITITNSNATGFDPLNTATQFVKKENYEIAYNKAPLSSLGKGSCKLVNADPINLINNNCA